MKEIFIKILGMAVVIFLIILILFLFIDCKMDNAYLKSKNAELEIKINDLSNELKVVQDAYARFIAEELKVGLLEMEKTEKALPEKEIRRIRKIQSELNQK